MFRQRKSRNRFGTLAAMLGALVLAGCATWQGPRIDPTGERLLIWPNNPPVVAGPPPLAPTLGAPTIAPPIAAPAPQFMGNVEAPPVYPDAPAAPPAFVPAVPAAPAQPAMPAPALPNGTAPGFVTPAAATFPVGQEHLRLVPGRVLAPVGGEVVLKAGVCAADGLLRSDRRVEWLLSRGGPAQFTNIGDRDRIDWFRWYWDTPRIVDPWRAIGATGRTRVVLRRGNLDPSDDVVVEPGETWVSVSSLAEGTSQVFAHAPDVASQFRTAVATILWVDVQWAFPPSAIVSAGQPHTLTTCVSRRTDGAPLAGWIVRYDVAGGAARLGYEAGSSVEVRTDGSGRASVEVTPSAVEGGVANIMMAVVRPAMAGAAESAPVEVARGLATITWAGQESVAPIGPLPAEPPPAIPPAAPYTREPAPFEAPPPDPYSPPRDEQPAAQPRLDVSVNRVGPEEVEVNQFVRFDVTVTNRGDATARGIIVRAEFDAGLSHPRAAAGEFAVEYKNMPDLLPGQSDSVPLTYQVVATGRQCHRVTVTADSGARAFSEACITGREAPAVVEPVISVRKLGPTRQYVGEQAKFTIVLRNTGTASVTNIEIVDKYDPAFKPVHTSRDHERGADGSLIWKVKELTVGERLAIDVFCECVADSSSACNNLIVTADGGVNQADQVCVEILPQLPPTGTDRAQPPATQPTALRPLIAITRNPMRVGEQATILVTVENVQQQAQENVRLRVALPPELTPDASQIEPRGEFVVIGQEVSFSPKDFAPGQTEFKILVTATKAGQIRIRARLQGDDIQQPIDVSSNVVEILPESL